jgi:hypothetical protein
LKLTSQGGSIIGSVRSAASGEAIAGFTILISTRQGPLAERMVHQASVFEPRGNYRVTGLEPNDYLVRALAHGFAPSLSKTVTVALPPAPDARADFQLTSGGSVYGRVIDSATRKPLEDARVSAESSFGASASPLPVLASVSTDQSGHFELTGLPPGLHSATANAFGYHGRISPAFKILEGQKTGPLEFSLTKLKEDEEPKLELAGIGAVLTAGDDALVIGRVLDGGGAKEAGLVPGDAILRVDGVKVTELGFQGTILKIRGPEGTRVRLTVRRTGGQVVEMQVYRRVIRG